MLSCSCGTRDNLNIFRRASASLGSLHVQACLTLLAQLITLLGIYDLLEGELALGRFTLFFMLLLIKVEDHDGAVGEFGWEFEVCWGGGFYELAAGAAVAYC